MRWLASTAVLAGTLLLAGAASASADYPSTIQSDLSLASTPQCSLCHTDGKTGVGTVNTLFGTTARVTYGLKLGDATLLGTVLGQMETDKVDSDGDGTDDIQELRDGTDPNVKGGGVVTVKPDLTYGCVASVAPGAPTPSSGAAFGLALVAAIAVARRRHATSRRKGLVAAAAVSAAILVGCYDVSYVSSDICAAGLAWTGGDRGSPNMHPGVACVECHTRTHGPKFTFAGTVYSSNTPDDCLGTKDTSIEITGADGKVITMKANESGNFYTELAVKAPYQARVISAAGSKAMFTAQTVSDCNSCHTETGANGAPGRITAL